MSKQYLQSDSFESDWQVERRRRRRSPFASLLGVIFNKGTIKLLAALSIPAGLALIFWYSQEMANKEVAIYIDEQDKNPTTERVTVENYELKEVDDSNRIRWQLTAKQGVADQGSQVINLKDVKMVYFDPATHEMKMSLAAPTGEAREQDHYVKLTGNDKTKVVAEGQGGKARLEAREVELTKKNHFTATGGVNIIWPEVAKVSGNMATGKMDSANLQDFKIVGNTHAEIVCN